MAVTIIEVPLPLSRKASDPAGPASFAAASEAAAESEQAMVEGLLCAAFSCCDAVATTKVAIELASQVVAAAIAEFCGVSSIFAEVEVAEVVGRKQAIQVEPKGELEAAGEHASIFFCASLAAEAAVAIDVPSYDEAAACVADVAEAEEQAGKHADRNQAQSPH